MANKDFLNSNNYRSNMLFRKRAKYNSYSRKLSKNSPHLVNFLLGEKMFYGRVTPLYKIPVSLVDQSTLVSLSSANANSSQSLVAMNFVALQYNRMVEEVNRARLLNKIRPDRYISQMSARKAFVDPLAKYDTYKQIFFDNIFKYFKKQDMHFLNITEMLHELEKYLISHASEVPFTYPSFIKSKYCDIMSSGLAIEIADLKYSDDESKVKHFINSPNWKFYLNLCNKYGFMIDQQVPWRIVADIESNVMKQMSGALNYAPGKSMFYLTYESCSKTYLKMFLGDILELYNKCYQRFVYVNQVCNGKTVAQRREALKYREIRDLQREISFSDAISFYVKIRIAETMPEMDQTSKNELIKNTLRLHDTHSGQLPIYLFEAVVSSTLDKVGSIVYYRKNVELYMKNLEKENSGMKFNESTEESRRALSTNTGAPIYAESIGGDILSSPDDYSTSFGRFNSSNSINRGTITGGAGGGTGGGY